MTNFLVISVQDSEQSMTNFLANERLKFW